MSDGTTIHQWQFHGGETQKWIFTHDGYGYYTIHQKNGSQLLCMNVENNSTALNEDIVLSYEGVRYFNDPTLWKISVTSSGAFKLTAKQSESLGYVLATSTSSQTNGARLIQDVYFNDTSYCDEWEILDVLTYAHITYDARILYDASCQYPESVLRSHYETAVNTFLTNFNIRFDIQDIEYSSMLDCNSSCHATTLTQICTTDCADNSSCNTSHHRSSRRLLKVLTSEIYHTYRLVGYAVCRYENGDHGRVVGSGNVNGKNSVTSTIITSDLTRSIQHELTHNLGASHNSCNQNNEPCVLKGHTNYWCSACIAAIKANY